MISLVCSNYFCHLLPTVANYCTNSLQRPHTNTLFRKHIHGVQVYPQISCDRAVGPITWGQRGRRPAAWLDTTRDGQIGNRLFLTQFIWQPDRTHRAGAAGCRYHCASGVTSLLWTRGSLKERPHAWGRVMDTNNGWVHIEKDGWMEGSQMLQGYFQRFEMSQLQKYSLTM